MIACTNRMIEVIELLLKRNDIDVNSKTKQEGCVRYFIDLLIIQNYIKLKPIMKIGYFDDDNDDDDDDDDMI